MSRRRLLVVVLLLALTLPVLGQSPPNQPTFGTGTTAVVVDVVVRDLKGNPVTDLRREDFELLEDGVRQEIADLTLVAPSAAQRAGGTPAAASSHAAEPTALPESPRAVPAPTFVALVFDRLTPEARALAYKGALAYLDVGRSDNFAGVFLSDLSLITVQGFTNDPGRIRLALEQVATRPTSVFNRMATRDALLRDRNLAGGDASPGVPVVASAESAGRPAIVDLGDRTANPFLLAATAMDTARRTWEALAQEQQGQATTTALMALASGLGVLPGRKTIVFFSEGLAIPDAVLPHFESVVATANKANVSIYAIDAAGLRVHSGDSEAAREVRSMGLAGITVLPDGSNMSTTQMMERNEDVLRRNPRTGLTMLAERTGGFLINNTNDLARGFQQIDADRRFHYLLTYTPTNEQFDGAWRNVTVRVPGRRVDVRARSGYLAVRALGAIPLLAHEGPALAALDRDPRPTDLPIMARAFVFLTGDEARLTVLASTPASAITFATDDKGFRADFTMLACIRDANGEVVRKASEPYRLSGPLGDRDKAHGGDVLFFRQPTLPAGRYTLDAVVHDALGKKAGVVSESFEVPATSGLAVSSLIVVGRGEQVADPQPDNPLYVGNVLVYPNLGEPIRKTDGAITLFLTVVPVAGRTPSAELELLRGTEALAKVPLKFDAPGNGRIQQLWRVPIDTLEPGDYTFRVIVADGSNRELRETSVRVVD
jgi:VWFA-related protein